MHHLSFTESAPVYDNRELDGPVDDHLPHTKLHDSRTHSGTAHHLPDAIAEAVQADIEETRIARFI